MGNNGGPAFSIYEMYQSLREDLRRAHEDLSERIDNTTNRVIEQNSRLSKSEERDIAIFQRLEALERTTGQARPPGLLKPATDDDQKPITRRDGIVAWWTLTAFGGGLVLIWQIGAQIFRMLKP